MNVRLADGSVRCYDHMDSANHSGYTADECTYCASMAKTPAVECVCMECETCLEKECAWHEDHCKDVTCETHAHKREAQDKHAMITTQLMRVQELSPNPFIQGAALGYMLGTLSKGEASAVIIDRSPTLPDAWAVISEL